ncbi:MAG TPA: T9SS type A sorting domain-containing protein [Lacibacter sp.]|nr:T9SS type A sorting domain-containing protein [Lacibacter sp.]
MKISLYFFTLFISSFQIADAQWINGKKPDCSNMATTCKKTAIASGEWSNPAIWSPTGVPTGSAADNVVCIPNGVTVQIKNPQYPNNPVSSRPTLYIFVCGTLEFIASGKLYLSTASTVNIMPSTGRLTGSTASTIIEIGDCSNPSICEWQGPSVINAPYYISGSGKGAGVLAASLKNFHAKLLNSSKVEVNWISVSEQNSLDFTVERSINNKDWNAIASVPAKGNSNSEINYQAYDPSPAKGINFYRLKETDINGTVQYSTIAKITNRTTGNITIFPNPVSNTATVYSTNSFSNNQTVQIFSMNGALIKAIQVKAGNTLQLPVQELGAGVYFIRLTENGTTVSETKLVKQ